MSKSGIEVAVTIIRGNRAVSEDGGAKEIDQIFSVLVPDLGRQGFQLGSNYRTDYGGWGRGAFP